MRSLIVAIVGLLSIVSVARAQDPSDGIFVGSAGWVWKTVSGPTQWQRMRAQGYGDRAIDPLIACRVDRGTAFVVTGRTPAGFWVEVADGPDKGCQGLATADNIRLHYPAAFEERQPAGTAATPPEATPSDTRSRYDPNNIIIIDRRPVIVVPRGPTRMPIR